MTRATFRLALVAALPALASCSGPPPTRADYVAVTQQVIRFIQADVDAHQLGRQSTGPRWVDVQGFAAQARPVTGDTIPVGELMQALGRPRIADPRQVLLQDTEEQGGLGGTWVREYGTYVSPNVARAASDQITMIVVGYVTDRRAFPTTICDRSWRLRFRKQGTQWALSEKQQLRDCREDEA
jgi:hypothetical protein